MIAALSTTTLMTFAPPVSSAAPATTAGLVCPERWGRPGDPLVSREDTAKAIFLAVEAEFFPEADKVRFPAVKTEDQGDRWAVWRGSVPHQLPDGSWSLITGGGQLSIEIAKCDGAISRVFHTK